MPNFTPVTPTNRSGVISSAGTPMQILDDNPGRMGFNIQNQHATAIITITFAPGHTVKLQPYALYEAPENGMPVGFVTLTSDTAATPFSAWEW